MTMQSRHENNASTDQQKVLAFTCPQCGGHSLKQFDDNPFYRECDVVVRLEYKDDPYTAQIDWESEPVYTRRHDSVDDPGWCCANCGQVLSHKDGSSIGTASSLAEWLLEHSPEKEVCREMAFQCPDCGRNTLAMSERIFIKAVLTEDGELKTVGDFAIHVEKRAFGCWTCEFVIKDENGPIREESAAVEWLKQNCKQAG